MSIRAKKLNNRSSSSRKQNLKRGVQIQVSPHQHNGDSSNHRRERAAQRRRGQLLQYSLNKVKVEIEDIADVRLNGHSRCCIQEAVVHWKQGDTPVLVDFESCQRHKHGSS
jgi:hypothetical protein